MVRAGGDAQIAYADGCISKVVPGKVVVIGPDSPCAMAKATLQQPYITGAVDVVGAAGAAGAAETAGAAGAAGTAGVAGVAGVSSGAIAAGGAAAAAVAAGVLVYTKYIKPASP